MISIGQLREIGKKTGLHLYQQEKDYLLKLFLFNYFRRYDQAVFKGGTCLRYLFNTDRFSEDLDFTIPTTPLEFGDQVEKTLKDIGLVGIKNGFIKKEVFRDAYTCEIWFHGPLYKGTEQTRNKFRIDAGKRGGVIKVPKWQLLSSEYPETRERFLVQTLDDEEILAEKVDTLLTRNKGRDLYDVWFLIKSGIRFDPELFRKKHKEKKTHLDITKKDYERDMEKLTTVMVPYEQIREEVEEELKVLWTK